MTLEDFEKQLADERATSNRNREKSKDEGRSKHRHHHHQRDRRGSRDDDPHYEDNGHRSKRSKQSRDGDDHSESKHRRKHHHHHHRHDEEDKVDLPGEPLALPEESKLKRDSWMEAPSALDVDYVQRTQRPTSPPKTGSLGANFELKIHENELNHHLRDLQGGSTLEETNDEPAQHEVAYVFGDAGSKWRMTKLKAVYRKAKESGREVDDIALERFGTLREFDDAREEEIELDRRDAYGKDYVGKDGPSGELFQERLLKTSSRKNLAQRLENEHDYEKKLEGVTVPAREPDNIVKVADQSTLNRLKAKLLRAQMMKDPKDLQLEKEYNDTLAASERIHESSTVTLSAMDNRMLSSGPRNEVKAVGGRRAQERGNVEENEDMTIDDMVREERRTRGQVGGEGQRFAERIAKDAKFDNDLEYMDENAAKLAKRVHKSEVNLRNTAISDFQKVNKILDSCPLCHHEDTNTPPIATVVSLATRVYLTLPTQPELSPGGAVIVPIQHHTNLLECDDDEWEEVRNFMKCLTRLYHDQGRDVLFYENAAFPNRGPHAALNAVPLPYSLGETAPAFFKDAFLTSEEEWSQHKKIIDTLARSKQGLGKLAFRRSLVKEMPYFHVWFEMDGGLGHIVEDGARWPKGDLFAREIIGGMLDQEPDVIKRQGRWQKGHDPRVDDFKKRWKKVDWTIVLTEGLKEGDA